MDNAAIAFNTTHDLLSAYKHLNSIFNLYCFELQQFVTNDPVIQTNCRR